MQLCSCEYTQKARGSRFGVRRDVYGGVHTCGEVPQVIVGAISFAWIKTSLS